MPYSCQKKKKPNKTNHKKQTIMNFEKSTGQGQAQLSIGIFEGKVVGLNLTRKQMCEWRGWELKPDDKELEYVGEDKDGNTRVTLDFCIEDVATGKKFSHRLMITDKKSASEKSGKLQYVSQTGMSTWVDDKKNLPGWFLNFTDKDKNVVGETDYRQAYMGEADVYEFFRNWLNKVNWFSQTTNVLLDMKKIFRGNVDEIRSLIAAEGDDALATTTVFMATVYITEKDGEKKMYQNLARMYMPGYRIKNARLACSTNSWDADKNTKRFKESCIGEYGIKDAFALEMLKDFDESQHINATDNVIQHSTDAVDNTDY
jgi:hypothetical protein